MKAAIPMAALVALLSLPALATAATTTVGANLSQKVIFEDAECGFETHNDCGSIPLEVSSPSSPTRATANGTVKRWRIEGASELPGYGINVVRRESNGTWTVTASSPSVTPAGNELEAFSTNLPIKAGEYVEFNLPASGGFWAVDGLVTEAVFEGGLSPGQQGAEAEDEQFVGVGAYNADLEFEPPSPAPPPVAPPVLPVAPLVPPAVAPSCVVPKVGGAKLKAAKRKIRAAGCKVGIVSKAKDAKAASAKVTKQSPKPGKSLAAGSEVSLGLG